VVSLWDLLMLTSGVVPLGVTLGVARAANHGIEAWVLAIIVGLLLGVLNVWMMWRAREFLRTQLSANWLVGAVYVGAMCWIIFGDPALAYGILSLLMRLVSRS